jgi:hypothetical protein
MCRGKLQIGNVLNPTAHWPLRLVSGALPTQTLQMSVCVLPVPGERGRRTEVTGQSRTRDPERLCCGAPTDGGPAGRGSSMLGTGRVETGDS